ncbi:ABC transporter substrate-binding protein [Comamonas kerstersii]|uniref:ABC transporter substrate-binding protein n=1 Tax=Comamonas kerstersii TaxID=225992 RepID=A0A1V3TFT6_9BURK|nr:tripartite tricarboxylate transporter substrate binding protein [Comamonas kerstersii]AQZ97884.1 ABC transporter substrate-binding protein [Comamonas kerstersii]OOH84694.1 ABC transporter substrate-binding protein [Comamonas kerstersii]OOH90722.1 ABC transporter substrate-binding protein [Comamonas kerstersii]
MSTLILRRTLIACGAALLAAGPAMADDAASYPNKPVTIVVGYPAGGSTDLVGRLVANEIEKHLGQTVIVENLGGAGGAIGAQKVANAKPDGYTLLVGANNEIAIANMINKSIKYKISDFTPIGVVASQPMVLVASQKAGVKNTEAFYQAVKANPAKFSYGSSGVGTALHLAGEMMKDQAQIDMQHVPYRGVPALTNDVLGNNIEYGVFVLSSGLPLIKAGKVQAIATTEAKRYAATPDIPALAEHPAFKNVDINSWFAMMGPANMPAPVVAKIKEALNKTMAAPEFRKKMEDAGAQVMDSQIDASQYINGEIAKYQKIIDVAKIEL